MYAKVKNNVVEIYPFYIQTLKQENPNTSFPSNIETDLQLLADFDVFKVFPTQSPTPIPMVSKVIEATPCLNNKGQYEQAWDIVALTQEEINSAIENFKADVVSRVQMRLDLFSQLRKYDSILSASSYVNSSIVNFRNEALYAVEMRDQTWNKLYQILNEVVTGVRQSIPSYEEIEAELPILQWPEFN